MTSIARQAASSTSRPTLFAMVRDVASSGLERIRHTQRSIREAAVTAQLGRDPETEIGRWTGARI